MQALQAQNLAAPVGRLNGEFDERTIRLRGRLETPAEFAQLSSRSRSGRVVRLGDVADAQRRHRGAALAALFNGEEAVGIDIKKAKGYSTTEVADAIREQVDEIQATLPAGRDASHRARRRRARRGARCATSRRRWSRARC